MQISKISRCPRPIREELNRRLDQDKPSRVTLKWLNSLPEVQAILQAECQAKPIKRQNLSDWRQTGLLNWHLAQTALELTDDSLPEDLDPASLEPLDPLRFRCDWLGVHGTAPRTIRLGAERRCWAPRS